MNKKIINRGKQLKFVRVYRGYTQQALCRKIQGLSQSNLSKFERGFSNQIDDKKLAEIMKLLNWPLGFLDVDNNSLRVFTNK